MTATWGEPPRPDVTTLIGVAVVLLALAGTCALLGSHLLIGALRLAAGALAGLGLATLALIATGTRLPRRPRRLLSGAIALMAVAALTVPAVLTSRPEPLEAQARAAIDPLGEEDRVSSVPAPDDPARSPVLIRRADGSAQLLRGGRVDQLEPAGEDVLALSADGGRLLRIGEEATQVLALPAEADPSLEAVISGQVLALAGDLVVARACEEGTCRISGYDLAAAGAAAGEDDGAEVAEASSLPALWTTGDGAGTRGVDPAGLEMPAVPADPDQPTGLLDAAAATGLVPHAPLRFDPAQGWVQLDPATGFPVGQILARPEQTCRIAGTGPPPGAPSWLQEAEPVVLTVCSEQDGAMTARAHQDGAMLWESQPSPAGRWQVRLEAGRVLATGTESGTDVPGEIVASQEQADWTAPGGAALEEATTLTARLGIDGSRMVVANSAGQLLAYDTADGANTWTLPLPEPEGMRGALTDGTAIVLDPAERTEPLQPRRAQRLRIIDAATGEVTQDAVVTEEITSMTGLSGGRALVTTEEHTLLLGGPDS